MGKQILGRQMLYEETNFEVNFGELPKGNFLKFVPQFRNCVGFRGHTRPETDW